jgi:hypothetical protein
MKTFLLSTLFIIVSIFLKAQNNNMLFLKKGSGKSLNNEIKKFKLPKQMVVNWYDTAGNEHNEDKVLLFAKDDTLYFDVPQNDSLVEAIAYNQIEFSLTHHTPLTDGQLDYMQLHNIQPMAWKPLGEVFSSSFNNPILLDLLNNLATKYNCTVDILLLAWVMQHPTKVLPVIGSTSIDRISNQKAAINIKLSLEDWFEMYTLSMGSKVP